MAALTEAELARRLNVGDAVSLGRWALQQCAPSVLLHRRQRPEALYCWQRQHGCATSPCHALAPGCRARAGLGRQLGPPRPAAGLCRPAAANGVVAALRRGTAPPPRSAAARHPAAAGTHRAPAAAATLLQLFLSNPGAVSRLQQRLYCEVRRARCWRTSSSDPRVCAPAALAAAGRHAGRQQTWVAASRQQVQAAARLLARSHTVTHSSRPLTRSRPPIADRKSVV